MSNIESNRDGILAVVVEGIPLRDDFCVNILGKAKGFIIDVDTKQ